MNLKENTLLQGGKYRIIGKLGQGGFGITYLAEQFGLDRKVAIKEFFMSEYCNRDNATSGVFIGTEGSRKIVNRFIEKFLREARNIASLKHPNIIAIHDIFEENNTAYYVMEYHSGGSLRTLIDKYGAMNEEKALHYTRQVASVLKYIHEHRMMHLDIKPDNILIDENDNAILIDFGISKVYDGNYSQLTHQSTFVTYSPGYAPIEQYTSDGIAEFYPATDIYSLGATLFTLLTGKCPPLATRLVENSYLIEELKLCKVSQQCANAVIKSMTFVRENRPQSIDEFLALFNDKINQVNTPFNWKQIFGITVTVCCIIFAGVGTIKIIGNQNNKPEDLVHIDSINNIVRNDSIKKTKSFKWAVIDSKELESEKFYNNGVKAWNAGNYAEAVKWYHKAAENEHALAQCFLGYYYEKGEGVTKDLTKAVKWYHKAAIQGNETAQFDLGLCYEYGKGVTKNIPEAEKWYRKAAKQGHKNAEAALQRLKK